MASKKNNPKSGFVRLKVDHLIVDRTQYKPYMSQLSAPEGTSLFVDIPFSEDMPVDFYEDGSVVLTLDGMVGIMVKVADAITAADDAARVKRYGH